MYRSKDGTLPKFDVSGSHGPEDAGEIFFDVSVLIAPHRISKGTAQLALNPHSDSPPSDSQPNLLTEDGTGALSATAFSKCGKYFAYGVSLSGSDFFTIYVRSTDSPFSSRPEKGLADTTGRLDEVVRYCKFSGITWTHDSKGFFYQVRLFS